MATSYVFACLSSFLSAKFPVFITQVGRARRIYRRGWEKLGYAIEMDEQKLSSWITL